MNDFDPESLEGTQTNPKFDPERSVRRGPISQRNPARRDDYKAPRMHHRERPTDAVLERGAQVSPLARDHREERASPALSDSRPGLAEYLDLPMPTILEWVEKGEQDGDREPKCALFLETYQRMMNKMERYLSVNAVEGHLAQETAKLVLSNFFKYTNRSQVSQNVEQKIEHDYASVTKEEATRRYREWIGEDSNVVPIEDGRKRKSG